MTRKPKSASLPRKTQARQATSARRKSAPAPAVRASAALAKSAETHGAHKKAAAAVRPAVPLKPASGPRPAAALKGAPHDKPAEKGHDKSTHAGHKHAAASPASGAAEPRRGQRLPEDRQSQLKLLIARGKEQGYLTYAQVNDHLPAEIVDPEQIEGIVNTINDMGIPVYEKAPDTESLLASEPPSAADDEAIEEAAAALAALDAELGRTTDPVRMYMREMGTVELLTREGEIRIAKRIEEGLEAVKIALGKYPATFEHLLRTYELVKVGQARLIDLVVGFIDPNAPDVIAQPQNPTKIPRKSRAAWPRSANCCSRRWPRSPSTAPTIPRRRNCASASPVNSWSSSSHRACSTR